MSQPTVAQRIGPYRILEELASGCQGIVYRAVHEPLNRIVCLKLLASTPDDDEALRRFIREMRVAATLSHPNIVKVFDGGVAENPPYLVMELLDGYLLEVVIQTPRPLPRTLSIAIGLADGLAHLHQHRILHRDLKPSNVFLTTDGVPKLLDFGLSRMEAVRPQDAITATGSLVGTPLFMAPELLAGKAATPASDMWALGCVLYLLYSGRMPFPVTTAPGWAQSLLSDPIPALSDLDKSIPRELADIVSTLVIREPNLRLASAAVLRDRLQALAHLPSRHAGSPSPPLPAPLSSRKRTDHSSKIVVEPRPTGKRWRDRWALPLATLCALATLGAWRFRAVQQNHPQLKATTAPIDAERQDSSTAFGRWRKIEPYLDQLQKLYQPGKKLRLNPDQVNVLERLVSLELGDDPGRWMHWVQVGRWLESTPRPPMPARDPAAQAGIMDPVVERFVASALQKIVQKAGQQSARKGYQLETFRTYNPECLVNALRISQNYPDDPLGWFFLGRALDVEGLTRHAATIYQLALSRNPRRTFTTATPRWAWWALVRALLLAPGHSLETEWLHEEALRTQGHFPEWPWEAIAVSEGVLPGVRERILTAAAKQRRTAEFASLWLGRVLELGGNSGAAIRVWEDGLAAAPRNSALAVQLLGALLRSGQIEAALAHQAKYRPPDCDYDFGKPAGARDPFTESAGPNAERIAHVSAELSFVFRKLAQSQAAPAGAQRRAAIEEAGLHEYYARIRLDKLEAASGQRSIALRIPLDALKIALRRRGWTR